MKKNIFLLLILFSACVTKKVTTDTKPNNTSTAASTPAENNQKVVPSDTNKVAVDSPLFKRVMRPAPRLAPPRFREINPEGPIRDPRK